MTSDDDTERFEQRMFEARRVAAEPLANLLRFDDAACVITGGASGIGSAIAERFGEVGAALTLVDTDARELERRADSLGVRHNVTVTTAVADVRDREALIQIATTALPASAGRHLWINSAGIYPTNLIGDMTEDAWAQVIDIDLTGTLNGCIAAVEAARVGHTPAVIVNLSSVAGFRTGSPPGIAHYAAAKHGVQGLTKALAVELGPEGIRVVAIAPGAVVTEGLLAKFGHGPEWQISMSKTKPIARPSLPDDVARTAIYLASPLASMVTGTTVPVDGGHLAL